MGKESKPAILILGDTKASSPVGTEILLQWLSTLLKNEAQLKTLLENTSLHIIPRPFPDSINTFFKGPRYEFLLNSTKIDSDSDLQLDEDGFEDLNKDGFISLMRIKDEDGDYYQYPESKYLMTKKKNEKSPAYTVYSEGVDNDKDEKFNEDPAGGVNPNKNFSFLYSYFKKDSGVHQFSEGETKAIADFAFKHPEIFLVFSFGEEDNLVNTWKEDKNKKNQEIRTTVYSEDEKLFNEYSTIYKKAFALDKIHSSQNKAAGSFAHWAYYHFGRISLSAIPWEIPIHEIEGKQDNKIKELQWLEKNRPQALIDWSKFQHPDFPDGEVEIGGIKPFYSFIPDAKTCTELAVKFQIFMEETVKIRPKIQIKEFTLEKLGKQISRLTLKVKNTGTLPIRPMIGDKSGKMYPLNIKLSLPEKWKLYEGTLKNQIHTLNPEASEKLEWLILTNNTEGQAEISLESPHINKVSARSGEKK